MLIFHKREITAEPLLLCDVHINSIITKSLTRVNLLKRLKYILDRKALDILYKSFIRPLLEYGGIVWDGCGEQNKLNLKMFSMRLVALCVGAIKGTVRDHVYGELDWELLSSRCYRRRMMTFHSILYSYCPQHLLNIIQGTVGERTNYRLRNVYQLPYSAEYTCLPKKKRPPTFWMTYLKTVAKRST